MNFTMTKIAAAAILIAASTAASAAPQAFTNNGAANFTMYDPTGAVNGNFNDITGFVDYAAGTFGVASVSPFFGLPWTASGGTMFGPGSYTISTVDTAPAVSGGSYNVTVGAGQMGGHIDFAWGGTTGIDVLMVWNVVDNMNGTSTFTSVDTDADANAWAGTGMIDGPFPGFSANFSFIAPNAPTAPIPEASTYGMMLAGLGLVGFAVRRRKLMA
jgi:hypothetical protein